MDQRSISVPAAPARGRPSLAVADGGKRTGPVTVLLHSLGADRAMWRDLAGRLGADHRVVVPDLRGHGGSGWAPTHSADDWADDLAGVLDHLDIERASFVGLSLGGVQALAFALLAPERVEALVLADTFAQLDPEVAQAKTRAMTEESQRSGMPAYADAYIAATFAQPYPPGAELVRHALAAMSQQAYADAVRVCFNARLADRLGEVGAPTLVLWGDRDDKTPRPLAEQLAAGIPGAVLREIRGAGHLSNLDAPALFAAAVAEHLTAAQAVT